jgi:hypothetical protein
MKTLTTGLSRKLIAAPTLEPARLMSAWSPATYARIQRQSWIGASTWAVRRVAPDALETRPTFSI